MPTTSGSIVMTVMIVPAMMVATAAETPTPTFLHLPAPALDLALIADNRCLSLGMVAPATHTFRGFPSIEDLCGNSATPRT